MIETTAMFEHILNFAHTGNARVLIRNLMDRAWLSLGCLADGMPCISDDFILHHSLHGPGVFTIVTNKWPVTGETRRPLTASKRTQELMYGEKYYIVSLHDQSLFSRAPFVPKSGHICSIHARFVH